MKSVAYYSSCFFNDFFSLFRETTRDYFAFFVLFKLSALVLDVINLSKDRVVSLIIDILCFAVVLRLEVGLSGLSLNSNRLTLVFLG